jgi:ascorbate-specific PTS system EIIC-type component UlaA
MVDEGTVILRNVRNYSSNNTVSSPRRLRVFSNTTTTSSTLNIFVFLFYSTFEMEKKKHVTSVYEKHKENNLSVFQWSTSYWFSARFKVLLLAIHMDGVRKNMTLHWHRAKCFIQ